VFVDLESADGEVNAMIGAGADNSSSSKVVMVVVGIMVTVLYQRPSGAVGGGCLLLAFGLVCCWGGVEMLKGDVRFGNWIAFRKNANCNLPPTNIADCNGHQAIRKRHLFATDPSPTKPQPQS